MTARLYLDRGFATTERFIVRTLGPELASLREGDLPPDAKSRLQHLSQTHFGTTPRYRLIAAEGPDHAKTFTVEVTINERLLGSGQGRSKHTAEAQAAQQALLEIEAQALDAAG